MRLKAYAAETHQGPYLQVNEDGYDFDFENELFMVFDGFGGSGIGDRAVEKLKQQICSSYTQISKDPNATMPLYYNPKHLLEGNAIINSIMSAHQNLLNNNQDKPLNQRAGASAVVAVHVNGLFLLVGIGNCCAYHYRRGRLSKIIHEESFRYHSKDLFDYKFKSFPLNALGMYPELGSQVREVRLVEGDRVVIMTDGVYAHLSEEELLHAMNRNGPDLQERLNSLLKLSNSRGNTDNQTAMILEF
jgi:serine/threonine protein phosphatase PrpC